MNDTTTTTITDRFISMARGQLTLSEEPITNILIELN